jgi:hypothetical protein
MHRRHAKLLRRSRASSTATCSGKAAGGNLPIRVQTVKMLSFTEPSSLFAIV